MSLAQASRAPRARAERRAVIDCLVHPICSDKALRELLHEPWQRYPVPRAEHYTYPPPFGEFRPGLNMHSEQEAAREDGRVRPAPTHVITPAQVRDDLMAGDVDTAILHPLTRGVQ